MPTTCKMNFGNHPEKIVFSGQTITITVRLSLTEEIKVRGIYIHLRGKTHVRFLIDDLKRDGSFVGNEDILDMQKCLADGNDGEIQLLPGTYDYMFKYSLPHGLPSSFSSNCGHIEYTAQVSLKIPRWKDKVFEENFIVYKALNLNDYPELRDPVIIQKEVFTDIRRFLNTNQVGPFNFSIRMKSGAYSHCETINVEIEVKNETQHAILAFYVNLVR
ncbi:arrestin domain-containing protein 17-like, partial [Contarinia nasturtii]|uniref:arrestin domain-containing protein 17-like n=1 Tax=Contarinia nasturtii TaxID=265458 RepID=UPI0012D4BD6E